MGKIEWAMWANEQAIVSALVIILGGLTGVAGQFNRWQIGIYAIVMGLLIFLLEYPRGKRQKGRTIERNVAPDAGDCLVTQYAGWQTIYQKYLATVVSCFGPLTRNYFVRFIFHLILCVPCVFILPTLLGGLSQLITSIIYFVAAIKGEEWKPVDETEMPQQRPGPQASISRPPRYAPPRRPPSPSGDQEIESRM